MATRSTEHKYTFPQPFRLSAVDRTLPSGSYWVSVEEESLDGLSFNAWQRTQTLAFLPADALPGKAREVVPVDPDELAVALAANGLERT